jgi:IS30 family transposase
MKPRHFSKKKRKYTHLKESERYKIEGLLEGKKKAEEIAEILGRDRTTIYREIKRGRVKRLQSDLSYRVKYRADVGQRDCESRWGNKERPLKIGKDKKLEEYIRIKLVEERYSPDAIIGEIKMKGLKFEGMICTKTLYNYIDKGIFSGISNKNLWEKSKRKRRRYKPIGRISKKNRMGRSIEKRPREVNEREEYGHWEGDTLKGPVRRTASLLTLTERKSREEIVVKLENATQDAIREAIDGLEREYGPVFKAKFKSITFDNGVEFLDWRSLEVSAQTKESRTRIYFAHAYSAWERGTNENHNRMIRRFIPKGTDIFDLAHEEIQKIQEWMNNYPRKILGYKTPKQIVDEQLQSQRFDLKDKICRN